MHTYSVFAPNRWERMTWTEKNEWKQRKIVFDPNKLELVTFFIRDRIVLILKRVRMHFNCWCSIWAYLVKFLDIRFWPTPYHYRNLAVYVKGLMIQLENIMNDIIERASKRRREREKKNEIGPSRLNEKNSHWTAPYTLMSIDNRFESQPKNTSRNEK